MTRRYPKKMKKFIQFGEVTTGIYRRDRLVCMEKVVLSDGLKIRLVLEGIR